MLLALDDDDDLCLLGEFYVQFRNNHLLLLSGNVSFIIWLKKRSLTWRIIH